MESKVVFNQRDLILKVNKNYDKSILNLDNWENYLDVLCGNRSYQKDAIKNALIYLASKQYSTIEDLVKENYFSNTEINKKYMSIEDYLSNLQIPNKLYCPIRL